MPKKHKRKGGRGRGRKRAQKTPERRQRKNHSDSAGKRCSPMKDAPVPPGTSNGAEGEVITLFQMLLLFVWNIAGHIKEGFNHLVGLGRGTKRPNSGTGEEPCKKKRKVSGSPKVEKRHEGEEQEKAGSRKRKRSSSQDETGPSTKKAPEPSQVTPRNTVPGPTSIDRLWFHGVLGEGGFGRVLLATDHKSNQKLAVKMVSKRRLVNRSREYIMLERQVLEITTGSFFLTSAISTFQTEDHLCYVMEYLSGGTLYDFLTNAGRLHIETTKFFAAEIVCGLQFLHKNGIIHRDLKPENILLDRVGHIRIADFGLALQNMFGGAKAIGNAGTPGYIAPEMYMDECYNCGVDWWAFGVILYEMATGFYPFNANNFDRYDYILMSSVLYQTPEYPEWLSSDTKDIIQLLLNKFPTLRVQMAANIRSCAFFNSINWEELEAGRVAPPFTLETPSLEHLNRTEEQSPYVPTRGPLDWPLSSEEQEIFRGFSFVSPIPLTVLPAPADR